MNLLRICFLAGASMVVVAGLVWRGGRRQSPEQREAERRRRINAQGRITDGCVLEVQQGNSPEGQPTLVVFYSYDAAGVEYHCAQDVTALGLALDPDSLGAAANIKFDPRHPGDSIVAAEGWCGLRIGSPRITPTS